MERHDFDVDVIQAAVDIDILDARIREMHVPVEVRQVVFARPFLNLRLTAIGPAIAIGTTSIPLLQELLVLSFQLAVELHAKNARLALLEPRRLSNIRAIDLRVVRTLPSLVRTRVERLAMV